MKKIYWFIKAFLANLVFAFPSKKLFMIGVTGTDGKTSTTSLIFHCLRQLGEKVDYISTVGANIGGQTSDIGFHVTTPRFFALQRMLRRSVNKGTKYFVLEVTSHAISQLRVWGVHFRIGVLTNITAEHLDYHRNYDDYAKTKISLINGADTAVINTDAPTFYRYKNLVKNKNVWYTGLNKKSDINFRELLRLGLRRDFNCFEKENLLLAYQVCRILGFEPKKIVRAINTFERVKGRFDYFQKDNRQFLVDFAHTPNAFTQLYKALGQLPKPRRIIHVFGCAGLRDQYKRAKMGMIAARNADLLIVTEEDYRTEKIEKINSQIEQGIRKIKSHRRDKSYFFVPNRQEAIEKAIAVSGKDDLIVLTGKAHEKSLARGKKEFPWDEYQGIDQALASVPAESHDH